VSVRIRRLKVLAQTCVFVKQSLGPFHCDPVPLWLYTITYKGHRLSRSYAVNLPSSLTTAHSSTLGFSPHLPVSVCGTVTAQSPIRGFSWQLDYVELWPLRAPCSPLGDSWNGDLPPSHAYGLKPPNPTGGSTSLLRHPLWSNDYTVVQEYCACSPSATPFGLTLGSD
jgi:hypothetical protein